MFSKATITFINNYTDEQGQPTAVGVQVDIEDDEYGLLPVSYRLAGEAMTEYTSCSEEAQPEFFTAWLKNQIKQSHAIWVAEQVNQSTAPVAPVVTGFSIIDLS